MNRIQTLLGLALSLALTACNGVPIPISIGPTVTASATFTPETPPTPTATATPVPVPTTAPLTRIQEGEQALFYGDYETARREFESAYQNGDSSLVQVAALWGWRAPNTRTGVIRRHWCR